MCPPREREKHSETDSIALWHLVGLEEAPGRESQNEILISILAHGNLTIVKNVANLLPSPGVGPSGSDEFWRVPLQLLSHARR
jgi:hypothetical protein